MFDKVSQFVQLFAENEDAAKALNSAKTKEEAVSILGQYGVDITVEEFVRIGKEITSDELSEDMLMLVSGGGWWGSFWGGVKDFFQGFLDAY